MSLYAKQIKTDNRFAFLRSLQIPVPEVESYKKSVLRLMRGNNFYAARFIAIDAFASYRIKVMNYIEELSDDSLKICDEKENEADSLILATVIFKIFNLAFDKLDQHHTTILVYIKKLSERNFIDGVIIAFKNYVQAVKRVRGLIQSSLSLMYALERKGFSAKSISKSMDRHHRGRAVGHGQNAVHRSAKTMPRRLNHQNGNRGRSTMNGRQPRPHAHSRAH